MYVERNKENLG